MNVFTGLWRALGWRDPLAGSMAFAGALSKFLLALLSGVPFASAQTWLTHEICIWTTVALLIIMILTLLGHMGLVAWPYMPVSPDSLAGRAYYICDSATLRDFERLSMLGGRERDRRVERMGRLYRFGWMTGISGERRVGIEYGEAEQGFKMHSLEALGFSTTAEIPNSGRRDYLTRLATELLVEIARHLESDADVKIHTKALAALSLVSVRLNNVYEPMLYALGGPSALVWGGYHGRISVMKKALFYNVDIDAEAYHPVMKEKLRARLEWLDDMLLGTNKMGRGTALAFAVTSGSRKTIKWALEHGADIRQEVKHGDELCRWRLLHLATAYGRSNTAIMLSDCGAPTDDGSPLGWEAEDSSGRELSLERLDAIQCACLYADYKVVEHLVKKHGADIANAEIGIYGVTAVHIACGCFGKPYYSPGSAGKIIKLLGQEGVDLDRQPDRQLGTPLACALYDRNWEAVNALIENGAVFTDRCLADTPYQQDDFSEEGDDRANRETRLYSEDPRPWEKERKLRLPLLRVQIGQGRCDVRSMERAIKLGDYALALLILEAGVCPSTEALAFLFIRRDWSGCLLSAEEPLLRALLKAGTGKLKVDEVGSAGERGACLTLYVRSTLIMPRTRDTETYQNSTMALILDYASPNATGCDGGTAILIVLHRYLEMLRDGQAMGGDWHNRYSGYGDEV
ncbi:ankyrin repeat-containing domain protein [Immersiella caudata]|uniref:Ankyrin repeat-containing domain protein n=1 Tax=Immersiella caudata TaxID=314043 RepID=A0AA39WP64_9PEZI|nr:ankyrin repeat-containing domain protein [Immersiella caudata]